MVTSEIYMWTHHLKFIQPESSGASLTYCIFFLKKKPCPLGTAHFGDRNPKKLTHFTIGTETGRRNEYHKHFELCIALLSLKGTSTSVSKLREVKLE